MDCQEARAYLKKRRVIHHLAKPTTDDPRWIVLVYAPNPRPFDIPEFAGRGPCEELAYIDAAEKLKGYKFVRKSFGYVGVRNA